MCTLSLLVRKLALILRQVFKISPLMQKHSPCSCERCSRASLSFLDKSFQMFEKDRSVIMGATQAKELYQTLL